MSTDISIKIHNFIREYSEMNIDGIVISCPYWMNRLKEGKVVLRGFANGKGEASEIREEIIRRLQKLPPELRFPLTPSNLQKFARRERIGIDCSGFAYRILNQLVYLKYKNIHINTLEEIFSGGINKTNVRTLTGLDYCVKVDEILDFQLGDMVRLWGGKHVAVILDATGSKVVYVHSSHLSTQTQGVHLAEIKIVDSSKSLAQQEWLEKTRTGENFGMKYFHPDKGDGVYRLKIFN
ncbi:hypothetical protein HY945_04310 [Candidatus Gottesmanbacteria bacterium]|nr:hypothetical protein [Candidatus Gottesmanbacteria bacterium]